ncbi:MAG: tRNA pseudouridine(54/55) synthase Pus10 [Thermoplasmata archaeon]|nr:MAG: tRNA pseudouridine(54/55) synthase Pus10 [Thermoplasmata archaeon]
MDLFQLNNDEKTNLQTILKKYKICDFCIGRIFSNNNSIQSFQSIGKRVREEYTINKISSVETCELCDGLINEIQFFKDLILNSVNTYEFSSFVIGFHVDHDILKREEEVFLLFKDKHNEYIKVFLKKSIGKIIETEINKTVSFDDADIMIVVNTMFNSVDLQIKPLYIYGRYNKLKRGIPQSKWFCRSCGGCGCRDCQYTGTLYQDSVEELIAELLLKHADGNGESFHGSGREDIDVRMLGTGRPFIIEISNPKKRSIDLKKITYEINLKCKDQIKVSKLRFSNKEEVIRIKETKFSKIYEISFEAEKPFKTEKLKKVALTLRGTIIQQFTPTRVAHRRAKKVRPRQIYDCSVVSIKNNRACFRIESASGTYIKELVTGDEGRTQPSISELIGQPCKVITLDVMEIKGE